ncbi:VPA1262 family protein [Xanthomonas arboricola]|uniref:VPA1262 family protein n=3 Tax=Xanthomonas arboricola TaxID=56448 RepID=A0AAP4KC57_9XANT|nr:VPA1262 family protein [Xanthomonas arboricola]MDN0268239.1 VPA1262 family protein [Xanthomonas arboricola pv. pruni]MDN0272699.1 VPA1262 family protein [Xanthomonas arboricola pv. pruni]MDN0276523.1 VPA1262 family protein [Xanthomonas arboricola pv. pruni]MDN0284624.1 VPA1262 family protein [Xanthomonas arboricola pv. pruni]MDN0288428.1 VPA1262 family protein [Xanthomonas arboricola pv. pruni]
MTDALDTLDSDARLHELFGDGQLATATQVWILEIERAGSAELRFLYGRSLPGTHQSHKWSGTSTSKTPIYDGCSAKTHALTLYTSTQQLKILLKHFLSGATLHAASQLADIQLDDKLNSKVGATLFGGNPVARPVIHLPTRDFFQFRTSRLSPTSYASVDSAAISSDSKAETFNMAEGLDRKIAEAACQSLNADTGLDFALLDAWRIGDFEFICIPGQNRAEKSKYDITLMGDDASLKLSEQLTQDASDLLVVVNAYSADSVLATHTARLDKHEKYPLKHSFKLEAFEKQICTSFTLEIYATNKLSDSFLVLQAGNYFVRGVNLNMHMVESIRSNEKLNWLEKRVPPKDQAKLQATARVGRALRDSRSQLGGHTADPWVALNSATETTMMQLCPKTSEGRFFLTLTDSGGTSRIQLTEWLRKIFENHHDAQIAWFDPFMEDVGIDLLHRMGTAAGDYLIITTEKESKEDSKAGADQPNRIQNLLNQCTGWGNGYFGNVRLKVLAVPENKIHDRMILIRSASGRPLAGYQLSNSIQRANDNYPLVATPIPLDVMPHVFEYCDQIIQSTLHGEGKKVPTAKLIFDSTSFTKSEKEDEEPKGLNHRSCFTDPPRAGDVLAWWLDDLEFRALSGAELMNQLEAKGKIKDGKLDPETFESIPAKFWTEGLLLEDFHSAWDAFGYVLAHCKAGQLYTEERRPFCQPPVKLIQP